MYTSYSKGCLKKKKKSNTKKLAVAREDEISEAYNVIEQRNLVDNSRKYYSRPMNIFT